MAETEASGEGGPEKPSESAASTSYYEELIDKYKAQLFLSNDLNGGEDKSSELGDCNILPPNEWKNEDCDNKTEPVDLENVNQQDEQERKLDSSNELRNNLQDDSGEKIPENWRKEFLCVVSMENGLVVYSSNTINDTLGYSPHMWIGKSFIDFVHHKDHGMLTLQVSSIEDASNNQTNANLPQARVSLYCRLRYHKELQGNCFGLGKDDDVYVPFKLVLSFYVDRNYMNVDGENGTLKTEKEEEMTKYKRGFIVVQATQIVSAYKTSLEILKKGAIFNMRHSMQGNVEYLDAASIRYLGYMPHDLVHKCAVKMYHPEDNVFIKKLHKTVMKLGHAPKSSIRMLTQNGDYVRVDVEFTLHTLSKKVKFVTGKHEVREGPIHINIFGPPISDSNKKETSGDMAQYKTPEEPNKEKESSGSDGAWQNNECKDSNSRTTDSTQNEYPMNHKEDNYKLFLLTKKSRPELQSESNSSGSSGFGDTQTTSQSDYKLFLLVKKTRNLLHSSSNSNGSSGYRGGTSSQNEGKDQLANKTDEKTESKNETGEIQTETNEPESFNQTESESKSDSLSKSTMETKTSESIKNKEEDLDFFSENLKEEFLCIVSKDSGAIVYSTSSLRDRLGYTPEMWVGRSFIDFVHHKDHEIILRHISGIEEASCSEITERMPQSKVTRYCRLRCYKELTSKSFEVKKKDALYLPFKLVLSYHHEIYEADDQKTENFAQKLLEEDHTKYKSRFIVIQATQIVPAYTTPKEIIEKGTKGATFNMRHTAQGNVEHLDSASIKYLGYMPHDRVGKCAIDMYYHEDYCLLKKIHETVLKTGQAPKTVIRMLTQNRDFVKVEVEFTCVFSTWSKKLKYITGKHEVIEGPNDIHIFGPSIVDKSLRPQNVMEYFEITPQASPKVTTEEKETNKSFTKKQHKQMNEMNLNKTHKTPNYYQMNYKDIIQKFFDSEPITCTNKEETALEPISNTPIISQVTKKRYYQGSTKNVREHADIFPLIAVKNDTAPRLTETALKKHNQEMEAMLSKENRRNRNKSKDKLFSVQKLQYNILRFNDVSQQSRSSDVFTCSRPISKPDTVLDEKVTNHNIDSDNIQKFEKTPSLCPCNHTDKQLFEANAGLDQVETNKGTKRDLETAEIDKYEPPVKKIILGNDNIETTETAPIMPTTSFECIQTKGVKRDLAAAEIEGGEPLPKIPQRSNLNGETSAAGNSRVNTNGMSYEPFSCLVPVVLFPNVYGQPVVFVPVHELTPKAHADNRGVPKGPNNQGSDDIAKNRFGNNLQNSESEQETLYKTEGDTSSSFYSSFLKIDSSGDDQIKSSSDDSTARNRSKCIKWVQGQTMYGTEKSVSAGASEKNVKILNNKKMEPPWMLEINPSPEFFFRYKVPQKSEQEILNKDKSFLENSHQSEEVNNQLDQLYTYLDQQGEKLTLDESNTSSDSQGEDRGSRKYQINKSSSFKLAMIYEEDAPMPSPENFPSTSAV